MKIAFGMHHHTDKGGISRYVSELAKRLAQDNEIHVITGKSEIDIEGVTIHKTPRIWNTPALEVASAAYYNTKTAKKLKKTLGIDIVHGQGAEMLEQDVLTSHSCHKAAVRELSKERCKTYSIMKKFEPRTNLVLAIEKHNYVKKHYKKIITVSDGVKRELIDIYNVPEDDIIPIPPGVNLTEFNPENKKKVRPRIRNQLNYTEDDFLLLFTGYEFKRKGLKHIIQSLVNTPSKVKLLVVGRDDPTPYIKLSEKLGVKDRITYTGMVPEIKDYYASADIFVFPTTYEAFSSSTLEAVASGIPILTTRVNGTEELVREGWNGYFIERNSNDISEKINRVLDEGCVKMGLNARKSAENYSWPELIKKIVKTYKIASET